MSFVLSVNRSSACALELGDTEARACMQVLGKEKPPVLASRKLAMHARQSRSLMQVNPASPGAQTGSTPYFVVETRSNKSPVSITYRTNAPYSVLGFKMKCYDPGDLRHSKTKNSRRVPLQQPLPRAAFCDKGYKGRGHVQDGQRCQSDCITFRACAVPVFPESTQCLPL